MGAWEEGRRLRRGPGGGGDRFVYGQWGEGRGRRAEPSGGRGFAALPAWDSVVALVSCSGSPQLLVVGLQRPPPTSPPSPGEEGCPDPLLQLADPGRRPVTQAPRGTWGGSGSCLESDPPFPSLAAPPHAFALPGQSLLLWWCGRPPGPRI